MKDAWVEARVRLAEVANAKPAIAALAERLADRSPVNGFFAGLDALERLLAAEVAADQVDDASTLEDQLGAVEPVAEAVAAVPDFVAVVTASDRAVAWKDVKVALVGVANAVAAKGAGLGDAVSTLRDTVDAWDEAEEDWRNIGLAVGAALRRVDATLDHVAGACDIRENGARNIVVRGERLFEDYKKVKFGPDLAPEQAREAWHQRVDAHAAWSVAVDGVLVSRPLLLHHRRDAWRHPTPKGFLRQRSALTNAFGNDAGTVQVALEEAYDALLETKGPWKEAQKAAERRQLLTAWIETNWHLANGPADTYAGPMAAARSDALDVVDAARLTQATWDLLLGIGTAREGLALVARFPNDAHLAAYVTHFHPRLAVSGANFEALVNAGQLRYSSAGYQNPFVYRCQQHGEEAEAYLDVLWVHSPFNDPLVWGVVHVHYHAKRRSVPDGATYYHVKRSQFAASLGNLGRINAGGARAAIDNLIPDRVV